MPQYAIATSKPSLLFQVSAFLKPLLFEEVSQEEPKRSGTA